MNHLSDLSDPRRRDRIPHPEASTETSTSTGDADERAGAMRARSKLAAVLAVLACAGCCALPVLVPLGLLTGGAVAAATTGLTIVAGVLFAAAVLLWVLNLRTTRHATRRATAEHGCAGGACGCGG